MGWTREQAREFMTVSGRIPKEEADDMVDRIAATPTIEELQSRMEELTRQLLLVQEQLDQMKTQQEAERRQADLEHLRQAAHAEAAQDAAAEEVDTTTKFVSGTRMQAMLNPELLVTGDIFFVGGEHEKEEFLADHFELDIQSYLDPYTKMHLVIGYHGPHHGSTFGMEGHEEEEEHDHGASGLVRATSPGSSSLATPHSQSAKNANSSGSSTAGTSTPSISPTFRG